MKFDFSIKKYKNNRISVEGLTFDSELEYECFKYLKYKYPDAKINIHVVFQLTAHDKNICKVLPDFEIIFPNGDKMYVDAKSRVTNTPLSKLKFKLFEAQYGFKIFIYPEDFEKDWGIDI